MLKHISSISRCTENRPFKVCQRNIQVTLETIDIEEEGNEEWFNKFRYEIPVFFPNKKFVCKNRIDLDAFNSALEENHTKLER